MAGRSRGRALRAARPGALEAVLRRRPGRPREDSSRAPPSPPVGIREDGRQRGHADRMRLSVESGIGHEREYVRFWSRLEAATDAPGADWSRSAYVFPGRRGRLGIVIRAQMASQPSAPSGSGDSRRDGGALGQLDRRVGRCHGFGPRDGGDIDREPPPGPVAIRLSVSRPRIKVPLAVAVLVGALGGAIGCGSRTRARPRPRRPRSTDPSPSRRSRPRR